MRRILIVDDEEALREALRTYLALESYDTTVAASAGEAMRMDLASFDLVLLDIMMDGMSGTEMAARMKADPATAAVPVIFLTARDSDDDMVAGLRLGADDYIAKPYSARNVVARIEAVLRRSRPERRCGVECDRTGLTCRVDGRPVILPRKEFELLALLMAHPGRIFSREELLDRVWPEQTVVADRTVDAHITRLRGKIAPYGRNIVTRSGYGYGWQD